MGSNRVGQDLETEQPQHMKYTASFSQWICILNTLITPSATYPLFLGPGIEVQGARKPQNSQFSATPQLSSRGNWKTSHEDNPPLSWKSPKLNTWAPAVFLFKRIYQVSLSQLSIKALSAICCGVFSTFPVCGTQMQTLTRLSLCR